MKTAYLRLISGLAILALIMALVPAQFHAAAAISVFINEIHYDNTGTDAGEAIEIAGPAGTDLTGWSVVLYNGSGGALYNTTALSGSLPDHGSGYGTVVINYPVNGIQNGAPDGIALVDSSSTVVQFLSYEGSFVAVGGPANGMSSMNIGASESGSGAVGNSLQLSGTGLVYEDFSWQPEGPNTFGAVNTGQIFAAPPPPEVCGAPFTPAYDVQGSGQTSPLEGTIVSVEGVVVGDFQNNSSLDDGDLNGFHIQDPTGDGNPETSDGIFVFAGSSIDVAVGDVVRVRGTVTEYFGLTEISASTVLACSSGSSVAATAVSLPVASVDDWEAYEGMLVTFPQPLIISEYFNYDRFGELVLTSERHETPTAVFEPGSPQQQQAAEAYLLDRITLDDGRSSQNPDPAIHPNGDTFDLDNLFRGGDLLENVTGIVDYAFNLYRIQPTEGAVHSTANPRTASPPDVGGSLKVASFNVLNYFTTIDTGNWICGPSGTLECRGADTVEEFTRQRAKVIAALAAIDADIVGLIEIENNEYEAVADLVQGLNDVLGAGTYAYVDTGYIGSDAIKVALIYKPATVTLYGDYAILDSTDDPRFIDSLNRPVLAQSFAQDSTGGVVTIAVNHLKSKGSDCNAVGDPDTGDGSGNCNVTRTNAAAALVDWLASDPTNSADSDFLIIGDLNSYDKENPIDAILAGADDIAGTTDDYTDLIYQYLGEDAYSYVFDGQTGYLDHALVSADLVAEVTGASIWHINADEPDLIDYDMTFKLPAQDALYSPDPYRSSDHDPVIVGLNLGNQAVGFFTGGGWVQSPVGAYAPNPSLEGKAEFKFDVKYKKGGTVPNGSLSLVINSGILTFQSTGYDWLVTNGTSARFQGTGTLNGAGEYKFLVYASDGSPDTFRIIIWYEDSLGVHLVYDNGGNAPLSGGSITYHPK